jgi:hypothetical protein
VCWDLSGAVRRRASSSIVSRGCIGCLVVYGVRRQQAGSGVPHNDADPGLVEPELLIDLVLRVECSILEPFLPSHNRSIAIPEYPEGVHGQRAQLIIMLTATTR